MVDLYTPTDMDDANIEWRANCGPGALAALLGLQVMDVRPRFPHFPEKARTNLTQMQEAMGRSRRETPVPPKELAPTGPFPRIERAAMVQIQWTGRWTTPAANPRYAYLDALKNSHWCAARMTEHGLWVYDVNFDGPVSGGWMPVATWERDIATMFVKEKKSRTGWYARELLHLV